MWSTAGAARTVSMSMSRSTASESSGSHLDGQASGCVDPVVTIAAGRSLFRADDLARLAEIVAAVACAERAPRDGGGKKHA